MLEVTDFFLPPPPTLQEISFTCLLITIFLSEVASPAPQVPHSKLLGESPPSYPVQFSSGPGSSLFASLSTLRLLAAGQCVAAECSGWHSCLIPIL